MVKLKTHKGSYGSPKEFADDIRIIFSNWKSYIKDHKSEVCVEVIKHYFAGFNFFDLPFLALH